MNITYDTILLDEFLSSLGLLFNICFLYTYYIEHEGRICRFRLIICDPNKVSVKTIVESRGAWP